MNQGIFVRQAARSGAMLFALAMALAHTVALAGDGPIDGAAIPPTAGLAEMSAIYRQQVDRRLDVPPDEAARYGHLAFEALARAGIVLDRPQYTVVIDRDRHVQAVLVYWLDAQTSQAQLIGASPASTGRGGAFEYFETPLGVFEHSLANPDFRAEGTRNALGIHGYGVKGVRVYDLGWQQAERLWGRGGTSAMRLQMHSTDADILEPRLGSVPSKGCIRIPADLNHWLDHYGVLDADCLAAQAAGAALWVLPVDQQPVADAGRYLIVVDTQRTERPDWSPAPAPQ